MRIKEFILFFLLVLSNHCFSQRPHLEIGGTLGFKDEFFSKPRFDTTAKYTEFHLYDIYLFTRVSKLKWGGEFGLGFEKAGNYFTRLNDKSTSAGYININRLYLDVSPYFYLIKESNFKWDIQLGLRNYVNLTDVFYFPYKKEIQPWKMGARLTTNFTFKTFLFGVYYEYDLKSDYAFDTPYSVFGLRLGLIY